MLDPLRNWLSGLISSALEGFDKMLASAADVLKGGLGDWDAVLKWSKELRSFCYIIIAICLLIELAQIASKVDIIKWEHGLKIGVKMVLAKVCIDNAPEFLKACYVHSQDCIAILSDGGSYLVVFTTRALDPLVQNVKGFGNILGMFLSSFIVLMAIKICGLLIQVIAYGRMFELYVYLAVSPLPCAFMPLGTGDGASVNRITSKFFKSFIAVCLQGVMMIVVIRIFDTIMSGAIEDIVIAIAADPNADVNASITDLIYTMLLGAIALVMAVVKSGSWAKGIMDAM